MARSKFVTLTLNLTGAHPTKVLELIPLICDDDAQSVGPVLNALEPRIRHNLALSTLAGLESFTVFYAGLKHLGLNAYLPAAAEQLAAHGNLPLLKRLFDQYGNKLYPEHCLTVALNHRKQDVCVYLCGVMKERGVTLHRDNWKALEHPSMADTAQAMAAMFPELVHTASTLQARKRAQEQDDHRPSWVLSDEEAARTA